MNIGSDNPFSNVNDVLLPAAGDGKKDKRVGDGEEAGNTASTVV